MQANSYEDVGISGWHHYIYVQARSGTPILRHEVVYLFLAGYMVVQAKTIISFFFSCQKSLDHGNRYEGTFTVTYRGIE